jgi:ABC-type transport system involved in multi-copper enzyme maturation permease subunit
MTTLTAVGLPPATGRSGLPGALKSEWTKIRSVRSTLWTLLGTAAVTIGISTLFSWGQSGHIDSGEVATFDAARSSMFGLIFGQLIIVVIGAMTLSSEYSTGMIRTSLTSMPRRGNVFAAKLIVLAAVSLVTGLICSFASFFVGQVFFADPTVRDFGDFKGPGSGNGPDVTITHPNLSVALGDPGVLRAVVGGGLVLAGSALLAFGLAAIMRHTAGAITTAIGMFFVAGIMVNFLPNDWQRNVDKWVPFNAGGSVWAAKPTGRGDIHMFGPWAGFGVFIGYAVVAIVIGAVLFKRRDA